MAAASPAGQPASSHEGAGNPKGDDAGGNPAPAEAVGTAAPAHDSECACETEYSDPAGAEIETSRKVPADMGGRLSTQRSAPKNPFRK
eukprot:3863334-Pyramimonas_sp.AAC.1